MSLLSHDEAGDGDTSGSQKLIQALPRLLTRLYERANADHHALDHSIYPQKIATAAEASPIDQAAQAPVHRVLTPFAVATPTAAHRRRVALTYHLELAVAARFHERTPTVDDRLHQGIDMLHQEVETATEPDRARRCL